MAVTILILIGKEHETDMKRFIILALSAVLFTACSTKEKDIQTPVLNDDVFFASFEQPSDDGTRVFANEDLLLRWTADDRVSIFNKFTYNQQYRFTGSTGASSGGFKIVDDDEFMSGNTLSHMVSVYPYKESTEISETEVLTVTLPVEQSYSSNSFGLGANTMVSVTSNNLLQYKNVCGYIVIKLYGDGVSVSSITLRGNNGEKIAGKASVTMPLDGVPVVNMDKDATTDITLICNEPVLLESSVERSTSFWFAVPPITFDNGFSIVVHKNDGFAYTKSTTKQITITRNKLSSMSSFELEGRQPNNVIYYTSSDGNIIYPYKKASFGANIISNKYADGQGVITFDNDVTSIGNLAFTDQWELVAVSIPNSVESIGTSAFSNCPQLASVTLSNRVLTIDNYAFDNCPSLTEVILPDSIIGMGSCVFRNCTSLTTITLPQHLTSLGTYSFCGCTSLTSFLIPDSLSVIPELMCYGCVSLSSITIPNKVTEVGYEAFYNCTSLTTIDVKPVVPPTGNKDMFTNTNLCPIYIPSGSEEAYAIADYWREYALRMRVEGDDTPIVYCSADYSKDGEVIQLQQATVGRGVNIIFLGDGFLDLDMGEGGKYEQKMNEAMEQFFAYEPYYSFRNRFNIYAVKVVSKNDIYGDERSNRRLTYEEGDRIFFRTEVCDDYAQRVPNPNNQPLKICTICNTSTRVGRSWCMWGSDGWASCIVFDAIGTVLNHEIGGHGFAYLLDEYVEKTEPYNPEWGSSLDELYNLYGEGANVDWRSNPEKVRWAHFLKDPRYSHEGLGVFEGGYLYPSGIYRATENSMMRYNDAAFNAPSREQIYKCIMKYSEGDDWVYDYEVFAKADERGRIEAAEVLGSWKGPQRRDMPQKVEELDCPPFFIDRTVKEVGMDKNGEIIIVQ